MAQVTVFHLNHMCRKTWENNLMNNALINQSHRSPTKTRSPPLTRFAFCNDCRFYKLYVFLQIHQVWKLPEDALQTSRE